MATALQSFRLTARSCTCLNATKPYLQSSHGALILRTISSSPVHWKRTKLQARIEVKQQRIAKNAVKKLEESNSRYAQRALATMRDLEHQDPEEDTPFEEYPGQWMEEELEELLEESIDPYYPPFTLPPEKKKKRDTFMNMGEEEAWEDAEMMEDDEDDITSLGHGELERHREMRHYARLIAWEMPLLSKLAKPFEVPSADMPLRFRYTSYMGEHHPAEKKVVVEFTPNDFQTIKVLTPQQCDKLRKLVGSRLNPTTDIVKMSCEMYPTQAQNKRYLGNTIDALLIEARDPTDTFEDVPLDTRHHIFKPRPRFPEEWVINSRRKKVLEKHRRDLEVKDATLDLRGKLLDGVQLIEEGLKQASRLAPVPELVMAGKGAPKGGKRIAVRR